MAQYYGVTRTNEYLMHYGVKGMRWGVQRAKESGNGRLLDRHYRKAQKHLEKLNARADINKQKTQQIKYAKRAGTGMGIATLGMTGIFGANALGKKYLKNIHDAHDKFYGGVDDRVQRMINAMNAGDHKAYGKIQNERTSAYNNYVGTTDSNFKKLGIAEKAKKIAAVVDLAGLGYGGYAGTRSLAAYYRTTPKGHAKAVSKRDEFQREMNRAFAGTKYGKSKKRRR